MSYPKLSWKAVGLLCMPLALTAQLVIADDASTGGEPSANTSKPLTIKIEQGNPYNIAYADWTGTDENGNVYGFENIGIGWETVNQYDEEGVLIGQTAVPHVWSEVGMRGAVTSQTSISVPDSVELVWDGQTLTAPVVRFCFDYYSDEEGQTGFPKSPNLTDVYVNPNVYRCEWHGEGFARISNFHFSSVNVPEFYMYDNSQNYINVCVADKLYDTYADALANYDVTVVNETPATPVNINVASAGTLSNVLSAEIQDLSKVRSLIVSGNLDDDDLLILRRLPRLEYLDLSATTGLTVMSGCNGMKVLREVKLPDGIVEIKDNAFVNCRSLQSINIPAGVKVIGEDAFKNTKHLNAIDLPNSVVEIKKEAFYYSALSEINLENVVSIRENAFYSTNLKHADLSNAEYLGRYVFYCCRYLTDVKLGNKIKSIPYYGFADCDLKEAKVPDSVENIEHFAFGSNRNLKFVELGKNITWMQENVFEYTSLETVIAHMLFPPQYSGFYGDYYDNTTLYVPALTLNEYLKSDAYIMIRDIQPLDEDLTDIVIDREYTIKSDKGINSNTDLTIGRGNDNMYLGHLTVDNYLILDKVTLNGYCPDWHDGNLWLNTYEGSTFIPQAKVSANNVEINMTMRTGYWFFLSFPFDILVKDIKVSDDALWVVRKYSGEDRAQLTGNTWQNMTDETVLKAGEGYIFHCSAENKSEVMFTFHPAGHNVGFFANNVVKTSLEEYSSEYAHNASWNLVGNTFPAYFNIKGLGFDAPVTIWEGYNYYAYSPIDDDHVLAPFQAFFVQRQDNADAISFDPSARAHSREAALALDINGAAKAPAISNRSLFNIFVNGESGSDRTRLVINENASAAYESSRDASKFMSSEAKIPQIFVMNDRNRMAIDERPLGEGIFTLGSYFGTKGEYTISLETRNAEGYQAILTDNKTSVVTNITSSDYTFSTEAGLDEGRFTLALVSAGTGVDTVAASSIKINVKGNVLSVVAPEAVEVAVVAADGKVVASGKSTEFSVELEGGIYVVKAGSVVTKIVVR